MFIYSYCGLLLDKNDLGLSSLRKNQLRKRSGAHDAGLRQLQPRFDSCGTWVLRFLLFAIKGPLIPLSQTARS